MRSRTLLGAAAAIAALAACLGDGQPRDAAPALPASATPTANLGSPDAGVAEVPGTPGTRAGSSIGRSDDGARLFVADEANGELRVVLTADVPQIPPDPGSNASRIASEAVPLPGRPAQLVVLGRQILVTVRSPGLLLRLTDDGAGHYVEDARIALPDDAWGLAVSADRRTAVVTSAWTARVSVVDLETARVRATLDVAREPRAVVIRGSSAFVSHLTSADLTRVDGLDGPSPRATPVVLPAAPLRTDAETPLDASLGWALALSKDETHLFAPRHALGAMGKNAWFGAVTVDVLLTDTGKPAIRSLHGDALFAGTERGPSERLLGDGKLGPVAISELAPVTQPRAVAVRSRDDALVVVGEGDAAGIILPGRSLAPALHGAEAVRFPECGAPSGLVLSPDEETVYVYCAATFAVVRWSVADGRLGVGRVAEDPLPPLAAAGRRLFYDGRDPALSGGLSCNGCHPEGRDDGHVWHEIATEEVTFMHPTLEPRVFVGNGTVAGTPGKARQTPMLAGRVDAEGPYGWHAENPDLPSRILEGVHLHRWLSPTKYDAATLAKRAKALAAFLRQGLVPPPRPARALSATEQHGKALFESRETMCASCHVPRTGYTDRAVHRLTPWTTSEGFDEDDEPFRTPSLRFVGRTAPYYHDGSAATLEDLLRLDTNRMGHTSDLTEEDVRDLAAYLRTL